MLDLALVAVYHCDLAGPILNSNQFEIVGRNDLPFFILHFQSRGFSGAFIQNLKTFLAAGEEITFSPLPQSNDDREQLLVQPEMEKRRSPLVSIPPFGRGFSRHGVFRSDGLWAAQERILTPPFIVSMSPPGYPSAWFVPAVPASVSPGKTIVAPQRPAVSQHPVGP